MNNSSKQVMDHMEVVIETLPDISREKLEESYLALAYLSASAEAIGDKKMPSMINSALLISRSIVANRNGNKEEALNSALEALSESLKMDDSNHPLVKVLSKLLSKERN